MPQIKIHVTPDGETQMEGLGFVGTACETAMQPYKEAAGVKPGDPDVKVELLPEYFQEDNHLRERLQ